MKLITAFFTVFLFFFAAQHAAAQTKFISGTVRDEHSEEPIPYASVFFPNTRYGHLTDSAGHFSFVFENWPNDTLMVTTVGYQKYIFPFKKQQDSMELNILLERGTFIEGVVVKAKVNKGLYVWKKIVENKDKNDRFRFDNFSYELYNKLELDIKNVNFKKVTNFKPLKPIGDIINQSLDSTDGVKYLPTYLTEALSDYYYQKKPMRRREVIKAASTRGVNNESVIKFLGGTDQVVNVYNNFIPVMDKQFVSPASANGDAYYNYSVTDTQIVSTGRYYHLVFTPKRRGSNTFEGDCWVHMGTWGIQKMNLRLSKDANINFITNLSLIQEYALLPDTTWFLTKDKFVFDLAPLGEKAPAFIGRKTATYRNIVVNDTSVTNKLAENTLVEEVIALPKSTEKDNAYWNKMRHEDLSKTEAGIIRMIDTLMKAPEFIKLSDRITFIATGYKNLGKIAIGPWFNWITYNSWEGYRLRFDLSTNDKFNKHFWYHGYLAYGFKDQKFKGKAEVFYLPTKSPRRYVFASYTNDLDFGQNYYGEVTSDNVFALAVRKANIPIKFIRIEEKRLELFNEYKNGFSQLLTFSNKQFNPLQNLPLKNQFPVNGKGHALQSSEVSMRLRFAYLEKFLENTFFRYSLGSTYPIAELTVAKGLKGVLNGAYDYTKLSLSLSDNMSVPPLGSISYQLYGGKTFGTLPYVMLDVAPGNEIYYYNKYAFNMMNRYEFIHDQYAGLNWEHNIGNGIFRIFPKLKFRQFYTVKTLWGSLSDKNKTYNDVPGNLFQSLDGKTYMEIGTGIDNILKFFRVDFIWRVLPKNSLQPTTKKFGIFGSFRLAF